MSMIPILFELTWKTIWVVAIGLPLWSDGRLDAANQGTLFDCLLGLVLFPLVIPWGYVWANYVRRPGDRWGREMDSDTGTQREVSGAAA